MLCVFLCGALKQLRLLNREAGNAAYFEASVFFFAQVSAGLFNLWLSDGDKGNIMSLITDEANNSGSGDWGVADKLVPYFILTEYIPSIAFIYQVNTFSRAFTRDDERLAEE